MTRRYVLSNQEVAAPPRSSRTIMWYDPDGHADIMEGETKKGNPLYTTRKERSIDKALLHWGLRTPGSVADHLAENGKSTHFAAWKNEIHQFVDADKETWASGHANRDSVALDITQESPKVRNLDWFREHQNLDIEVINNPSDPLRGDARVLTLHPPTAQTVRDWALDMHEVFGIPLRVPANPDGTYFYGVLSKAQVKAFQGFLGHFHTSEEKWDPAPWWAQIWDPLVAAGLVELVVVDDAPERVATISVTPLKTTDALPTPVAPGAPSSSTFFARTKKKKRKGGGGVGGLLVMLGAGYLGVRYLKGRKKKKKKKASPAPARRRGAK